MRKVLGAWVALCLLVWVPGAAGQSTAAPQKAYTQPDAKKRAEAYYYFAMGRVYEELYESTSQSEYAAQAIESYKKAYQLDPRAEVISERLAEIYAKSQRIRDAVLEAQEILKRDPDNLAARRLLARIYVRTLGDLSPEVSQRETARRAIEQYREILRIDPTDSEAAVWLARLHRLQNEHDKAEEVLRGLVAREPGNEAALEQLSQLLIDLGKAPEAIALLEGAAAQGAPSAKLLNLLGDAYEQTRDFSKAEQAYRRAVELEADEPDYRRGLGQVLLSQEKYEEALEQYKRLIEMQPENPENYLRVAQVYRRLKKLDQAEESVLRAKQYAPGNLEVIYSEALLYEAQGRFDGAIRVLSDAVARVKTQPNRMADTPRTLGILYEQLGRLYREVENFPAALNTFHEMLPLGAEQEKRARMLIIDTHRASKDINRAIEESRKATELYPQERSVKATYALMLGERGDTDEAARILRGMLGGASEDRETYLGLAQVYERGRRFAEAEQAARLAEKLGSQPAENEMAWFLLGAIYERQKKYELAEEQFKKVLALNPRHAAALNYYGYMLAERGVRLDEAIALVKRALEEEAQNGAYLDSLGWAYFKQGRLSEAEEYLRRAAERNRFDPTIRDHLGDLFYKTGRIAQAAEQWEKSLAEWGRALPTEYEADRVAEIEKKLADLKRRLVQKSKSEPKP